MEGRIENYKRRIFPGGIRKADFAFLFLLLLITTPYTLYIHSIGQNLGHPQLSSNNYHIDNAFDNPESNDSGPIRGTGAEGSDTPDLQIRGLQGSAPFGAYDDTNTMHNYTPALIFGQSGGTSYDNIGKLNRIISQMEEIYLKGTRPESIQATFWIIFGLYNLGPEYLIKYKDLLESFLLNLYDEQSHSFKNPAAFYNYKYIGELGLIGEDIPHNIQTALLTHEMGIIGLYYLGSLFTYFNETEMEIWENSIKAAHNIDGGFGTYHAPNSTVHETLFAIWALYCIHNASSTYLSPAYRSAVQNYLRQMQYHDLSIFTYLEGAFKDYHPQKFFGYEEFITSMEALWTVELGNLDYTVFGDDFEKFVNTNNLYLEDLHCYAPNWDSIHSADNAKKSIGTAIIGEGLRVVHKIDIYRSEFDDCVSHLDTRYRVENTENGPNYFITNNVTNTHYLADQAIILAFLNRTGRLDDALGPAEKDGLALYLGSFINPSGGGSFTPLYNLSWEGKYLKWKILGIKGLDPAQKDELYNEITELMVINDDYLYFRDPVYEIGFYMADYASSLYDSARNQYYAIKLLHDFDLFDRFYGDIGLDWLKLEQYVADMYKPDYGGFIGDSRDGYQINSSLSSTFYALESLRMLFSYDEGQNILNYFTTDEISNITSFLTRYINENSTDWWVEYERSNDGDYYPQTFGIYSDLQPTAIIPRMLQFINGSYEIPHEKLKHFIINRIESTDWNSDNVWAIPSNFTNSYGRISPRLSALFDLIEYENLDHSETVLNWLKKGIYIFENSSKMYVDGLYEFIFDFNCEHPDYTHLISSIYGTIGLMNVPEFYLPSDTFMPDYLERLQFNLLSPFSILDGQYLRNPDLYDYRSHFREWFEDDGIYIIAKPNFNPDYPNPRVWFANFEYEIIFEGKVAPFTYSISFNFSRLLILDSIIDEQSDKFIINFLFTCAGNVFWNLEYRARLYFTDMDSNLRYYYLNPDYISIHDEFGQYTVRYEIEKVSLQETPNNLYFVDITLMNTWAFINSSPAINTQGVKFNFDYNNFMKESDSDQDVPPNTNGQNTPINMDNDGDSGSDNKNTRNGSELQLFINESMFVISLIMVPIPLLGFVMHLKKTSAINKKNKR